MLKHHSKGRNVNAVFQTRVLRYVKLKMETKDPLTFVESSFCFFLLPSVVETHCTSLYIQTVHLKLQFHVSCEGVRRGGGCCLFTGQKSAEVWDALDYADCKKVFIGLVTSVKK